MKDLTSLILKTPSLALIVTIFSILFLALIFQSASYKSFSYKYQKIFAILFIFLSPRLGGAWPPLNYLHPMNLAEPVDKPNLQMLWIPFLALWFIILFSRLHEFGTKKLPKVLAILIAKNPFFCVYIFLPFFSIFWSETPEVAIKFCLAYLLFTPIIIYLAVQYDWEELSSIIRWSYLMIGIGSYIKQKPPPPPNHWAGLTFSKNKLGNILSVCTGLWYLHYSHGLQSQTSRRIALIMTGFFFFLVRTNRSGGALVITLLLIGTVVGLGFVKRMSFQWAFTCIVVFIIISIMASIAIADNFETIVVKGLEKDLTLTGRTEFWPQILDRVNQKNPLLGYGYYSFWQPDLGLKNPAAGIFTVSGFRPPNAHNGYLEILVNFGWVGLFIFMMSFITNLIMAVNYVIQDRLSRSAIPMMWIMLLIVNNITESTVSGINDAWVYYVLLTVRLSLDTSGTSSLVNSPPRKIAHPNQY